MCLAASHNRPGSARDPIRWQMFSDPGSPAANGRSRVYTNNQSPEVASTVTGTLLDLIRQGKVVSDRLLQENQYLRAEVTRLTCENTELRARLDLRPGGTTS